MEDLRLVGMTAFALVALCALGSWPALHLCRGLRARLALAPALGLALATGLLGTFSLVLSMEEAVYPLGALGLASILLAVREARGEGSIGAELREVAVPASVALAGIALALAPGLAQGTGGPLALASGDALLYTEAASFARGHDIRDELPASAQKTDPWLVNGRAFVELGSRGGVTNAQAALAGATGTGEELGSLPLLAVFFGMVSLGVWACARNLGAGRGGAAFGACFGLSSAVALLVADVTFANLAGLALAPAAILLGVRALADRRRGHAVAAGLVLGGLLACYPEFITAYALSGALGLSFYLVAGGRATSIGARLRSLAPGAFTLATVALATAPVAAFRAVQYFKDLAEAGVGVDLPRNLHLDTFGSWLFGLQHVYELARFDQLSAPKVAFAVLLPLALAGLLGLGLVASRRRGAGVLAAPIAAAGLLAAFVYLRYDHCQYCLWKSATFALPFIAAGLGIGAGGAWSLASGLERSRRPLALVAVGGVGALALAGLVRSDADLAVATERSPAVLAGSARDLPPALGRVPGNGSVLIEGADSTAVPGWTLPEAFFLTRERGGARTYFDSAGFPSFVILPSLPDAGYYSPGYAGVVSLYPGLRNGRRGLGRFGQYALEKRAPIDVAVMRTGYSADPGEGAAAVPWIQGPFELWISSPRATPAALRLKLGGRLAGTELRLRSASGRPLAPSRLGNDLCVDLRLHRGRTVIAAAPRLPGPASSALAGGPPLIPRDPRSGLGAVGSLDSRLRPTEGDPVSPPAKVLSLAAARATRGSCPRAGGLSR